MRFVPLNRTVTKSVDGVEDGESGGRGDGRGVAPPTPGLADLLRGRVGPFDSVDDVDLGAALDRITGLGEASHGTPGDGAVVTGPIPL